MRMIRRLEGRSMQAYMTQPRKRLLTYLQSHAVETLTAGQISEGLPSSGSREIPCAD